MTNYAKQTTEKLVDDNGVDKALIAEIESRIEAREIVLKERVKGGENAHGRAFDTCRIIQNCESIPWKTIAERLGVSKQMITANKKPYTKDYFKYTARKTG